MSLYLGVDAGQSHLEVALVDKQGRLLGSGRTGPWIRFSGPQITHALRDALAEAVNMAFQSAGRPVEEFEAACFGMTGGWDQVEAEASPLTTIHHLIALEDVIVAHAGAFIGGPGILLIAGTGVVAYGVDPHGGQARVGGWGYVFGDEGGGYDIGIRCLRAAARAADGRGPHTHLLEAVLATFARADLSAVQAAIYAGQITHPQIAGLSRLVVETAEEGDTVAMELLEETADLLAEHVAAIARRLEWLDPPVSTLGGVFQAGRVLTEPFSRSLRSALPRSRLVSPRLPPVLGAALLALENGAELDRGQVIANLASAADQLVGGHG